ncbi:MAG: hypothetical protein RLZZ15_70 [Verrucomicrobiota bacterium]|jgi:hydrogenase/urease accessory protein HupE
MSRRVTRLVALLAVLVATVRAHDPGISSVTGLVRADALELITGFAPGDALQLLPPDARPAGKLTPAEFVGVHPLLEAAAAELWEARVGGVLLAPARPRVQLLENDAVSFTVEFPRPASGGETVSLRAVKLGALPPGHRQFVIIGDRAGITVAKKLLSAKEDALDVPLAGGAPFGAAAAAASAGSEAPREPAPGAPPHANAIAPTAWAFVRLGVEHIWTGYDHLLFLFSLLIVCRSFRSSVAIISCFTLAHSLTLALATFDLVNLPSRYVEPAIAASIVYVGVENIVRRGAEPRGRWALTFVFGLIHGFGFAGVLRELGVGGGTGGGGIALPLFTFNAGVELGQIAIAAVVLPIVWRLRKNEKFVARGVPALSAVVTLAGVYWFLQRTIWG